jgi:hypothetical protein
VNAPARAHVRRPRERIRLRAQLEQMAAGRRGCGEPARVMSDATTANVLRGNRHPNEVDRKRIERGLRGRKRYRYVQPVVTGIEGGYLVQSPCCSRTVDSDGGLIDVARFEYCLERRAWHLLRRDREQNRWERYREFSALGGAIEMLNHDPERVFWQ